MDQKYQNESAPIFCYAKCTKNSSKLHNIADLQALTPGRVKKITLYVVYLVYTTTNRISIIYTHDLLLHRK